MKEIDLTVCFSKAKRNKDATNKGLSKRIVNNSICRNSDHLFKAVSLFEGDISRLLRAPPPTHITSLTLIFSRSTTLCHVTLTAGWTLERSQLWQSGSSPTRASTSWGTIPIMAPLSSAAGGEPIWGTMRSGPSGTNLGPRPWPMRSCGSPGVIGVQTRFFWTGTAIPYLVLHWERIRISYYSLEIIDINSKKRGTNSKTKTKSVPCYSKLSMVVI